MVGVIFNNNGMATWCWEAAHALASSGDDVTLVATEDAPLPGVPGPGVRVYRVPRHPRPRGVGAKLRTEIARLSIRPDTVMRSFVALDRTADENPILLLNHTGLVDPDLPARQYVAAWARETRLIDYLSRARRNIRLHRPVATARLMLDTVGWWRRDWHGYRHATTVLATTNRFRDELTRASVRAVTIHPCVGVPAAPPALPPRPPVRLLSAALDLGDPRKRLAWMLDALREFPMRGRDVRLTLVGRPTADIERRAADSCVPVTFTGPLPRQTLLAEVAAHHAFLFASALDDWGYVVAEAMSLGRAVVVPDAPPFDEMGARGAVRFADDPAAFRRAVDGAIEDVSTLGRSAHEQAQQAFSHAAFAAAVRKLADRRIP